MNNEKQIAQAILDAQKAHEESYTYLRQELEEESFGEYTKDWEECFQVACKVNCLSPNLWSLLCLANHWYNDIQLWAEDVLAGKNILEEAEKENAKILDGQKHIDDIVNDDAALSAELAEMEVALRKEKEKEAENTDSDGNLLDSHRR